MLVNISDVGGHLAYYFATPLFMKKSGVFAICFNGKEMIESQAKEISADRYQQIIGSYVDLLANNCNNPAIQLVATQMAVSPVHVQRVILVTVLTVST